MKLVGWLMHLFQSPDDVGDPIALDDDGDFIVRGEAFPPDEFAQLIVHTGIPIRWASPNQTLNTAEGYYTLPTIRTLSEDEQQQGLLNAWTRYMYGDGTVPV